MSIEPAHAKLTDPDERIRSEALDWFTRRGSGLSVAEERAFQQWLEGDPARREAFSRWQADWNSLDGLPGDGVDTLRRNLAEDRRVAMMRGEEPVPRNGSGSRRARRRRPWLAPYAAAAVLILAAIAGWQAVDHWQRQPVYSQSWSTVRGQWMNLTLPDGSQLQLDTATHVAANFYRERREVHLPGGAVLFQVQGDAKRPFDVLAGPLRITVTGTRFSVRYTPDVRGSHGVRIAVDEGRISVTRRAGLEGEPEVVKEGKALELTAGQQVSADASGVLGPVTRVPATGVAPWREGRVSFNNTPLADALAEFERYGPTGLRLSEPSIAALRVTGTFDLRRPDSFAQLLPRVLPVKLIERDGTIEISARKGR